MMAIIQIDTNEHTYQEYFYSKLGISEEVRVDRSTDGYMKGIIFEHKKNLQSYGKSKALSQALIYLSRFNRDGIPVPAKIMLVCQESSTVYIYETIDYIDFINDIENNATRQASKGIDNFREINKPIQFKYDLDNAKEVVELLKYIEREEYAKVDITEYNIYGWATTFYNENPKAKKVEMFNEIRKPSKLKHYINPWLGKEKDFSLIMDLLNDRMQQKKLGAFYTPPIYAEIATGLVRNAIAKVPDGNDYIILDRCAGTGSLEMYLTEEELSHVIISTYELKEWHALKSRLGHLVRYIVPPIPDNERYPDYDGDTGLLLGANALDEEFISNENIMQYVNNPKCNVILFENPPYSDVSADGHLNGKSRDNTKDTFVAKEMAKEIKKRENNVKGLVQTKDLANLFIWSAFEYYLKSEHDSYILFSPIKYWKTAHLVDKKFESGYAFNREHFHATKSVITCIHWSNTDEILEELELKAIDIENEEKKEEKKITIKKVYKPVNKVYFDKKVQDQDELNGVWTNRRGLESPKIKSTATKNYYNSNIIGWLNLIGYAFDSKNISLTRTTLNLRKNGTYLREENYLNMLPLFCAKAYKPVEWYKIDIYSTTGDGGFIYQDDSEFIKKCAIYTCFSSKNKCRSFNGSDGRYYKNELCMDEGTLISNYIEGQQLDVVEKDLIEDFKIILEMSKKLDEYNKDYSYGLYQIDNEINISIQSTDEKGKTITFKKYGDLNNYIKDFKKKVSSYYDLNIEKKLFKYELIK